MIEENLKEIAIYVKNKLFNGDYKFIKCSSHTATIIIDEKFSFQLWIANIPKEDFGIYESSFDEYGDKIMQFTSQKDRLKAFNIIKPHIVSYKNKTLKREKQKQINRLEKELEQLK